MWDLEDGGERGRDSEKEENGVPERGHELKNTVNGYESVQGVELGGDIKGERKRVMWERGNKEMEAGVWRRGACSTKKIR